MPNFNIHDWRFDQVLKEVTDKANEHHNDEDFPGKDLSAWDLLDKLKTGNKELYDQVEAFMKQMDEASLVGTGTSFNAGSGEGYATPHAFAGKGKWKNKKYKYRQ